MPAIDWDCGIQTNHFLIIMNSFIFPVKHEPKVRSLKDVIENYQYSYAPEEFQRPEAWSKQDRRDYFQSVLMNRLEGNFVVVDLELAIAKLEKLDPNNRAYNYFKNLYYQTIEYIILDGNNRFKFLSSLMRDEFQIPKGSYTYVIEDDTLTVVVGSHNNVFSKLPKLVQKVIKERQLVISEYVQIDYSGLSEVFTNVNSGVPLNNQEKRNAFDSPWADYVRLIRRQISPLLITMFGSEYMRRLKGDEWIVEAIDFTQNVDPNNLKGVTQTSKNNLYKSDIDDICQEDYLDKFVKLADFIDTMIKDPEVKLDDKVIARPSGVMNLFWAMFDGIETYENAVDFMIRHQQAYKDNTIVNDDGNNYVWACGGLGAKNNELRMKVIPEIIDAIVPVTV